MKTETKVLGTINETHLPEVRQCLGDKVAERLENAERGDLFLNLLFQPGWNGGLKPEQTK